MGSVQQKRHCAVKGCDESWWDDDEAGQEPRFFISDGHRAVRACGFDHAAELIEVGRQKYQNPDSHRPRRT